MSEQDAKRVETRMVAAEDGEVRLDRWFRRHYPQLNQGTIQKLARTGQIRVDGKRVEASTRIYPGQSVRVPPLPDLPPQDDDLAPVRSRPLISDKDAEMMQRRVLFRDSAVIVLDKPAGLATQGGTGQGKSVDSLLDALTFDAASRPKLVHRLDRDTSGCLVLARTPAAASRLSAAFRSRDSRKLYWAVTVGVPEPERGRIDLPLAKDMAAGGERMTVDRENGQHAVSYYTVMELALKRAAFVALWPRTGRTHQLRVHMAAIGTPILGDGKYAGQEAFLSGGVEVPRSLHLHARRIVLPHPNGGQLDVTAPLPEHMRPAFDYFGFEKNSKVDPFAELDFS